MPKTCVVILNWNGWRDTLACLTSVAAAAGPRTRILILDNGSSDDSLERIREWRPEGRPFDFVEYDRTELEAGGTAEGEARLAQAGGAASAVVGVLGNNLGFARANNIGMRYAIALGCDYAFILNNDTVLEPDCLTSLEAFLDCRHEFEAATAQIRYFDRKDRIWNCGGHLLWYGARRYQFANGPATAVPSGHGEISFITGCAAMYRTSTLKASGLYTTRFFFGEEDFEIAWRMRREGRRMACVYDAVLYHKVGASIAAASSTAAVGGTYVHYLNRFVDIKQLWPRPVWSLWRLAYLPYALVLMRRAHGTPLRRLAAIGASLLRESAARDEVDRDCFEKIMRTGYLP